MPRRCERHSESFTLIELLIVIAIIGILAALIIVDVVRANNQAKYETVRTQMSEISTAANMWFLNEGNGALFSPDVSLNQPPAFVPKYLASWPIPPYANCYYDYNNWDVEKGCTGGGCAGSGNGHEINVISWIAYGNPGGCPEIYEWCIYAEPGYSCVNDGSGGMVINNQ